MCAARVLVTQCCIDPAAIPPPRLPPPTGAAFHVPHGLANAALISHVIRYNATDAPAKQAAFPQYQYPKTKQQYAELASMLNLGGNTEDEKVG